MKLVSDWSPKGSNPKVTFTLTRKEALKLICKTDKGHKKILNKIRNGCLMVLSEHLTTEELNKMELK